MITIDPWIRTNPMAVIFLLLLTACGGGGGGGGGSNGGGNGNGENNNNPPSFMAELIPSGTPVLFFTWVVPTGGTSDAVTRTSHYIVPETGETGVLYLSESFSFARSSLLTFTFDDRLFVLRNSGASGFGGGDWKEIDVSAMVDKEEGVDGAPVTRTVTTTEGAPFTECVAVIGNSLYWRSAGQDLRRVEFVSTSSLDEDILTPMSSEACFSFGGFGGMDVAEEQWYDTRFDPDSGVIEFFTRDLTDGLPAPVGALTPVDHAMYNPGYHFGFDGGSVYWARVHAGNQQLEIWRYDFVGDPQLLQSIQVAGLDVSTIDALDVDDGYIAIQLNAINPDDGVGPVSEFVLLFNINSSEAEVLDLKNWVPSTGGLLSRPSFRDLSIMFRTP